MVFMDIEGVVTCPTDWTREDRGLESNRKSNSFLISDSQGLVHLFSQFPALGLWINPFRVIILPLLVILVIIFVYNGLMRSSCFKLGF